MRRIAIIPPILPLSSGERDAGIVENCPEAAHPPDNPHLLVAYTPSLHSVGMHRCCFDGGVRLPRLRPSTDGERGFGTGTSWEETTATTCRQGRGRGGGVNPCNKYVFICVAFAACFVYCAVGSVAACNANDGMVVSWRYCAAP